MNDDWIRTYSGGKVYFFAPEKSENIELEDFFHPLSLLCRFNGATIVPYSVAQHSVLVADNIYKETENKQMAFDALGHDFSESFLSDIPSPFKKLFPGFKKAEIRMEKWIAKKLGFNYPYDPLIKHHDLRALATEMRDLMQFADYSDLPEPYPEKIIPLDWNESKLLLKKAFETYSN